MSTRSRIPKVKEGIDNVKHLFDRDAFTSFYGLRSLNDPARNYQVRITWTACNQFEDLRFKRVECECHLVGGVGEVQPDCVGNSNGHVCYHSLAVLSRAAKEKGRYLCLFDNFSDAAGYLNLGGELIVIVSAQGWAYCWGVVKPNRMKKRVELMRGPVEKGID